MKSDVTKDMLCESLKRLLAQKSLDKISIKAITDGCGLNRQTFYYHFDDIYQAVDWLLKKEAISIFFDQRDNLLIKEGLQLLFTYITANRAMCLNILISVGNEYIYRFFYDELYAIICNNLSHSKKGAIINAAEKAQLVKYLVISCGSYIVAWMMGIVQESPEEITEFLVRQIVKHEQ